MGGGLYWFSRTIKIHYALAENKILGRNSQTDYVYVYDIRRIYIYIYGIEFVQTSNGSAAAAAAQWKLLCCIVRTNAEKMMSHSINLLPHSLHCTPGDLGTGTRTRAMCERGKKWRSSEWEYHC